MGSLLLGLSVAWLLVSLIQLCHRRSVPVIYVPVIVALPHEALMAPASGEAWLRRQLEGLGKEGA